MSARGDAVAVRLAARLYAGAQALLPASLRAAHGDEMRDAFVAHARVAHGRGGAPALCAALLHALADALSYGFAARRSRAWELTGRPRASAIQRAGAMFNDVRLAARNLARRPGFTLVAMFTLALGIGANVAIFAVVHSVLLQPLPYPDSEEIVWIGHHAPGLNLPDLGSSPGAQALYGEEARSLAHVASVTQSRRNIVGADSPARIEVALVTPSLFDVLRVQPVLGRRLLAADAEVGAPRVAVLTHSGWSTHFGSARDVIGRTLDLDGHATEIVGVMPRGFAYPAPGTAALLPEPVDATPAFGAFGLRSIARLASGTTVAGAQAELAGLQPRHVEVHSLPADFLTTAGWEVSVRPLRDEMVGDAAVMLWLVLGTVSFLLLVACASVANLFLIRAESRQREIGVRSALGASRWRISSALLSESLLLGVAAGAWGVLLAWNAVNLLVANGPPQLPRLHEVHVGAPVLVFAALVSIGAGLLFGVLPLPQQLRQSLSAVVRAGRGETAGRDRQRLRRGLIVVQIAVALVLLTGSGLMLRSFQQLRALDPGVVTENVLLLGVSTSEPEDRERGAARYLEMLEGVRGLAGVRAAAVSNVLPVVPDGVSGTGFRIEGEPVAENTIAPVVMFTAVTDGYFDAVGAPLIAGRDITAAEVAHVRPVVVVNAHFARTFLDNDAVGRRIRFDDGETWFEIVGVAPDVRAFGLREDIRPLAYVPITTELRLFGIQTAHLIVRSDGPPLNLAPPIRALVRDVDANAPILASRTLQAVLDESLADVSFTSTVLGAAALIALLLGAIGLYGVISFAVAERRGEIGVRVALGASPADVRRMVVREGVALAIVGIALGLIGAAALTRLMQSVLFEVSTLDPAVFAVVAALLLAVTAFAAWVPARRAARIDPVEAMRGTT